MFRFLVIDEDLEIVKVALTVVAPWSRQDLVNVWVITLLLGHVELSRVANSRDEDDRSRGTWKEKISPRETAWTWYLWK